MVPRLTMEQYAELAFRVSSVSEEQAQKILTEGSMDPLAWKQEVTYWEARLSASLDDDEADELPALVADYARGVQAGQRLQAGDPIPLSEYVVLLRHVQKGHQLAHVLERRGWSLAQFLAAQGHWLSQAGSDESVRRALTGIDSQS